MGELKFVGFYAMSQVYDVAMMLYAHQWYVTCHLTQFTLLVN